MRWRKWLIAGGFCMVLGGCIDPSETARVALGLRGIPADSSAFVTAAALGQVDALHLLEQAGVSTSAVDPGTGRNAVMAAIEGGQTGAFEYLIRSGLNLEGRDLEGRTALGVALMAGRYTMAERLLESGASVEEPLVAGGKVPLEEMVKVGDAVATDLLLRFGADPGEVSGWGEGLWKGGTEVDSTLARVLALRDAGDGEEAGEWIGGAIGRGLFRSAEVVVEQGRRPVGLGVLELLEAVADGDHLRLRQLLYLGVNPDGEGDAGETAMEWAASLGDIEAADILVGAGGDPTLGLTAAVASGERRMVKYLLESGASPEGVLAEGQETPLSMAVARSDEELVRWLLAAGADPAVLGALGQPALLVAAARKDEWVIGALVEGGADPDVRSVAPHGSDFRGLVSTKTLEFYLKNDTKVTPLMVAAAQDDVASLEELMAHGATRWLYSGKYHRYALNFAAERSHVYNQQRLLGRDPLNETVKRKIVVDLSDQQAKLYENGKVLLTSRVSTGMKGFRTPAGEYVISNKYKQWTSTIYDSSMPYFQRLSCGSFGLHVGYVPNYPASHGCIRMPHNNAVAFFSKTSVGDPVSIVP